MSTAREDRDLLARLDPARLRAGCGIRAMTVAAAFGVTRSRLSSWERHGEMPRDPVLRGRWVRFNLGLARHLEIRET
jgi:DNA-binding transcriptional regulator YiaG